MYAIVDIAGQQFKVQKDQKIFVHRLEGEIGNQVDFDRVLLIDNDKKVSIGSPVIQGAMVSAKILEHLKGDKVIVFKKKRRKGYRVKNGHRQYMTQILIEDIVETGAKPKVAAKPEAAKPVVVKEAEAKVEAEAKPKAAPKKASESSKPKAAVKKVAEPKATAKPAAEKKATAAKKPAAKKPVAPKKTDGTKK